MLTINISRREIQAMRPDHALLRTLRQRAYNTKSAALRYTVR